MSDREQRKFRNELGEVTRATKKFRLVCASGCASMTVEVRVEGARPPIYCPVCKQPIPDQVWEPGRDESFWVPESIDNPPPRRGGNEP